ncbi:hypothetical protein IWZ01DRAFT_65436 [Phyllosticta capitalensis]
MSSMEGSDPFFCALLLFSRSPISYIQEPSMQDSARRPAQAPSANPPVGHRAMDAGILSKRRVHSFPTSERFTLARLTDHHSRARGGRTTTTTSTTDSPTRQESRCHDRPFNFILPYCFADYLCGGRWSPRLRTDSQLPHWEGDGTGRYSGTVYDLRETPRAHTHTTTRLHRRIVVEVGGRTRRRENRPPPRPFAAALRCRDRERVREREARGTM